MKKLFFGFLIPLLLFIAPFLFPIYNFDFDIATLLTVISLLFAILVGFYIATATNNYLKLQSLVADEDGTIIALFNLAKIVQPKAIDLVAEAIDQYVMAALDYELDEYVEKSQTEFDLMIEEIDRLEPEGKKAELAFQVLHSTKGILFRTRHEINLASRRIVKSLHWTVLISLAVLIIALILTFRGSGIFSEIVTAILSVTTYLVLILVYEIDGNEFLEHQLSFENSQQIFQAIGKPRYYPAFAIKSGRISKPNESHRVGHLVNYNHKTRKIELIDHNKK